MKIFLAAVLMTSTLNAFAGEKIDITVKGMVCSFCSQGITKKFNEMGVKSVNVDLGKHLVAVEFQDNQKFDQAKIEKLLADSGYGVEKIEIK